MDIHYIKSNNFGATINVFTKKLLASLSSGAEFLDESDGRLTIEVRDRKTSNGLFFNTFHGENKESYDESSNNLIRAEIHNLIVLISDEGNHKIKIQVIEKGSWDYLLDDAFPKDNK